MSNNIHSNTKILALLDVQNEITPITPVEVIGVIRTSEKPSIFVPANDPDSRQWFYVDVPAIARSSGLPEDTFYVEDINENVNPSDPYPIPKDVNTLIRSSVMPQDHLNYTLTWYVVCLFHIFFPCKVLYYTWNKFQFLLLVANCYSNYT